MHSSRKLEICRAAEKRRCIELSAFHLPCWISKWSGRLPWLSQQSMIVTLPTAFHFTGGPLAPARFDQSLSIFKMDGLWFDIAVQQSWGMAVRHAQESGCPDACMHACLQVQGAFVYRFRRTLFCRDGPRADSDQSTDWK